MAPVAPGDALSPEGFYSLYAGALAIEDETRRLEAAYVCLVTGRLAIRPRELTHLHEGWIDWRRGELRIPGYDPCACALCWERAERAAVGTDRSASAVVAENCWSPPGTPTRSLSFGWSERLTAAFGSIFAEADYLDADPETIDSRLEAAATRARGIDAEAISADVMLATAVEFLARSGFGPAHLAALTGIDASTAGDFARLSGGERRRHQYRTLASIDPPAIDGSDSPYRLVIDPEPFEREPFDPRSYDRAWREERAAATAPVERNPRPVEPPTGTTFKPAEHLAPREPGGDVGFAVRAETLSAWVDRLEARRHGENVQLDAEQVGDPEGDGTGEMEPGGEEPDDGALDPLSRVTEPVEFSMDTRFALSTLEGGRPTGGSIVLGQDELVVISRDHTGIADYRMLGLSDLVDLAPGYAPDRIASQFEETVGLSFEDDDGDRRIAVCEVPGDRQWPFLQAVFGAALSGSQAIVSDLYQFDRGIEAEAMELTVGETFLRFTDRDGEIALIRLDRIVDVEESRMAHEEGYEVGLVVHHMATSDRVAITQLRPTEDRRKKLLKRYLTLQLNRTKRRAKTISLGEHHRDVLEALYNTGAGRDLVSILDLDAEAFTTTVDDLEAYGLIRRTGGGMELTAAGFLIVDEEYGVIRQSSAD